ncbi:hypothetical protein CVT26_000637 [Gymnopilus dilepis]|uniref:Uncharacterized protein n=1 Tax=Gymnopilus dilepis TaxID=231916 RepID=A0A409WW58_9AGAR|nr:hypothetical protein CVT26_000637 [Gymnopilus dilepis]
MYSSPAAYPQSPRSPQRSPKKSRHQPASGDWRQRLSALKTRLEDRVAERLGVRVAHSMYKAPAGWYDDPKHSSARPYADPHPERLVSTFLTLPPWRPIDPTSVPALAYPIPKNSNSNNNSPVPHASTSRAASLPDPPLCMWSHAHPPYHFFAFPPPAAAFWAAHVESTVAENGGTSEAVERRLWGDYVLFWQLMWVHFLEVVGGEGTVITEGELGKAEVWAEKSMGMTL